jgi:hypothetical protein
MINHNHNNNNHERHSGGFVMHASRLANRATFLPFYSRETLQISYISFFEC